MINTKDITGYNINFYKIIYLRFEKNNNAQIIEKKQYQQQLFITLFGCIDIIY